MLYKVATGGYVAGKDRGGRVSEWVAWHMSRLVNWCIRIYCYVRERIRGELLMYENTLRY